MRRFLHIVFCIALDLCSVSFGNKPRDIEIKAPKGYRSAAFGNSAALQTLLGNSLAEVLASYPAGTFKPEQIAATLIDVREPKQLRWANVRGDEPIYPASVVKMFYMA